MKQYKLLNEPLLKTHGFCSKLRFKRQSKIHLQDNISLYLSIVVLKESLSKAVELDF